MTYSIDLRKRVVNFVRSGGTKAQAAKIFSVNRATVYDWLGRADLAPKVHGPRRGKLNKSDLYQHVMDHPDALLRERAAHFGVHINAIWVALRKMGLRKKKSRAMSSETIWKGHTTSAI